MNDRNFDTGNNSHTTHSLSCKIYCSGNRRYVGCSESSWNLVIKCSNIYIILSFFLNITGGH